MYMGLVCMDVANGEDESEVKRWAHLPLHGICSLLDVARISYHVVVIMMIFLLIMDHRYIMIIGILMTIIEHFGPVYGQPGKQHEPRLQGHVL